MHSNGQASRSSVKASSGYADRVSTKVPNWHWLVVWDTWLNALATGLFLAAAVADVALPEVFAGIARIAYPIALVFLLIDLAFLVLDLGDPWRFHHMLRVFKPTSPMSLGTWCLTIYSVPLTLLVALDLLLPAEGFAQWLHYALVVLGLVPALGSAVYKGVLFSTTSQPGWKDARWLGAYFTNSAIVLGGAGLLGLALLLDKTRAFDILRRVFVLLSLFQLLPLTLLAWELAPSLMRVLTPGQLRGVGLVLLAGGVLPLVLVLISSHQVLIVAAILLTDLNSWIARFVVVWLPHFHQHASPAALPAIARG
jgi:hypothetical protein